jgi:hypothetical protein
MNRSTITPNQKDSGFEDSNESSTSGDQILTETLSRSSSKFLSTSLSILN